MPLPTPGVAIWRTNVSLPAGADAPTRASLTAPFEELADRTKYLADRLGLPGPNPRQITFSPIGGVSGKLSLDTSIPLLSPVTLDDGWRVHEDSVSGLSKGYVRTSTFGVGFYLDITPHLRTGVTLTSLLAFVDPGTAQATIADRMTARVLYTTPDIDADVSINSAYTNATASVQTITVPLLDHVVSRVNRQYFIHVVSSQGAAVLTPDEIRGFTLSFTEPAGVTARNY